MGLFDWMKGSRETQGTLDLDENQQGPAFFTRNGNPIDLITHSTWESDGMGVCQLRSHVGKSCEGYHAGVERSHSGGSAWTWSLDAYPTEKAAKKATDDMTLSWHVRMSPYTNYIEALQRERARAHSGDVQRDTADDHEWDR